MVKGMLAICSELTGQSLLSVQPSAVITRMPFSGLTDNEKSDRVARNFVMACQYKGGWRGLTEQEYQTLCNHAVLESECNWLGYLVASGLFSFNGKQKEYHPEEKLITELQRINLVIPPRFLFYSDKTFFRDSD